MEQGALETTELLDIMATNAPQSLIGTGLVDSVFKVMTTYKSDDSVLASCITALERVSRKGEGIHFFKIIHSFSCFYFLFSILYSLFSLSLSLPLTHSHTQHYLLLLLSSNVDPLPLTVKKIKQNYTALNTPTRRHCCVTQA